METAPKNNLIEGKPRPSILPMDVLIKYLCPAYEEGIIKYYRESWRKGFAVSNMVDAAQRHITAFFWKNEDIDPDSLRYLKDGKHHLAGAIFSLLSILQTLETKPELDDRKQFFGQSEPKIEHFSDTAKIMQDKLICPDCKTEMKRHAQENDCGHNSMLCPDCGFQIILS